MTSLHKLSLPTSINTSDDSFSRDLIRQFDKRRSRLHFELGLTSQAPSEESSIINTPSIHQQHRETPVDYSNLEPIQLDHDIDDEDDYSVSQKRTSYASKRSSSASDLFKRSSAFLMSKLNLIKKNNKPEDNNVLTTNKQTKLLMKTTIAVPSTTTTINSTNNNNNNTSHLDQVLANPIPVITQYPPKPLVYSPVEPIPDTDKQKPLLHRISMPLLRVYQDSHSLTRNKSIASFVTRRRKSEPHHTKKK